MTPKECFQKEGVSNIENHQLYRRRRVLLLKAMKDKKMDAIAVFPGSSLYYLTGLKFKPSERLLCALLLQNGELYVIAPEVEEAKVKELESTKLFIYKDEQGPLYAVQQLKIKLDSIITIGFETNSTRMFEYKALKGMAEQITDCSEIISSLRIKKDETEIGHLRQAVRIIEESLEATLTIIKPGLTELDVAAYLEYEMRKRGSEGTPFGTIVASGYRGALPHGRASDKVIESGELVVLDFGSIYQGYAGDITRTIAVGDISDHCKEVYEIVKKAQANAVQLIKPGITASAIDQEARKVITEEGYGAFFNHRTGHGLGIDCHESPYIMDGNDLELRPGMIFTVEPGIYLPGKFGVRIEDNLVVTESSVENLMTFTRELIVL